MQRRLHKQRRQEAEGYNRSVFTFTSALCVFSPKNVMIVNHSGFEFGVPGDT